MKQLAIQDGDLVLGQGGFATVSGANKVRQDLSCALREPIGTDRFHPAWGSTLASYVGEPMSEGMSMLIEAEVYRVVQNYMTTRAVVIQDQYLHAHKPQFSATEIISTISSVEIVQQEDRYFVKVRLDTLAHQPITLTTTVEA